VQDVFDQLGPIYFRRAFRMTYPSFQKLAKKLEAKIIEFSQKNPLASFQRYVPNGPITPSVRLACALRYFAGASLYDLMITFGIGHTDADNSIWYVVDAINDHPDFSMHFPTDHDEQQAVAAGFERISAAGFNCVVGAVDGILIWIHRPSENDCMNSKVSSGKFFCGRKHKFGLNCQAVCDARGRFMDISIVFPGSTSDCLAFEGMSLFRKLEGGLLAPGLCLFGDNAYLNTSYMATPYTGAASGGRDDYNFYHSQVRIRIECAFGMLTHRWAILRKALPMGISLQRSVALVVALAKLHNYCINETVPSMTAADNLQLSLDGGVPLERSNAAPVRLPRQLMDGGDHFEDMDRLTRRQRERDAARNHNGLLPRERLCIQIQDGHLSRPPPDGRNH
jgi:DDE superfamily endonuclease